MTPKRNRSMHVSVGLMTALSLGVASLAGCASFDPNPAGSVAVVNSTPSATTPATPGSTPGTPPSTGTPAAAGLVAVTGQAILEDDTPIAQATVRVYDAFTNKPVAGIVAADGMKTDATGKYSFEMPALTPGQLVRVVVIDEEDAPFEALLGTEGDAAAYTLAAEGQKKTFQLTIDLSSSITAGALNGTIKMMAASTSEQRAALVTQLERAEKKLKKLKRSKFETDKAQYQKLKKKYKQQVRKTKEEIQRLDDMQPLETVDYSEIEAAIKAAIVESGLVDATETDVSTLVADALKAILAAAQKGELSLNGTVTLSNKDFPSALNVNVDKLKQGDISYTDPISGKTVEVDVEVDQIVDPDDPVIPDDIVVVDETDEGTDVDDFISSTSFIPSVTLSYTTSDTVSPLRMVVSQGAGQLDVKTITAKIPTSYVAAVDLSAATPLNDTAATAVSGAWVTSALTTAANHEIRRTTATATSFSGNWVDGNARQIATVTVTKSAAYVTVTLNFDMTGNNAITTRGGTVTMDILSDVITLHDASIAALPPASNNIAEITITSRKGSDTTPTTTTSDQSVSYTRPIAIN